MAEGDLFIRQIFSPGCAPSSDASYSVSLMLQDLSFLFWAPQWPIHRPSCCFQDSAFNRVTPYDYSIYKLPAALRRKEKSRAVQVIKIVDFFELHRFWSRKICAVQPGQNTKMLIQSQFKENERFLLKLAGFGWKPKYGGKKFFHSDVHTNKPGTRINPLWTQF